MDTSVSSLQETVRRFGFSLFGRGFTKATHHVFLPHQSSGLHQASEALLGLVLMGEMAVEFPDCQIINGMGDEFFIPAQVYYQLSAGPTGVQFLCAKARVLKSVSM
jgi:hypothetical protein